MPKVSVVIPVYNGEAYLRQCLDSVCAQTLEEIEIICVDDGSTDGSWEILEEYREKDERFHLLRHKETLGLPTGRNNGFAQAQGKYVIFWDGDDFFEPQALEHLYLRAEETEAEICVCRNDLYDHETGRSYSDVIALNLKRIPEGDTFNRLTNPEHILDFTNAVVWNKLFLRIFLIENDIIFQNFRNAEDRPFTFVALCLASKIAVVDEVLVHYRWNNSESQVGKISRSPREFVRPLAYAVDQLIERDILPIESIGRRALQLIRSDLQNATTEADFVEMYNMLRTSGESASLLQKCNIIEREPGYYYNANDDEYVKHLLHDKPGDLLAFMLHDFGYKNKINAANRRKLSADLKATRESRKAVAEELKAKKEELKAKKEELKSKKDEIKATKAELKAAKEELKAIKAERTELKAELKATKSELRRTKGDLEAMRNSKSFRLGRALLYLPRKIRDLLRHLAQK